MATGSVTALNGIRDTLVERYEISIASISSGSYTEKVAEFTKNSDGYTYVPLGIVGYSAENGESGSGQVFCRPYRIYISEYDIDGDTDLTVKLGVRNAGTSAAVSNVTFAVYVLFAKTEA